jgi:hypothetical protein
LLDIDSALKSGQVIGGQVFIKRLKEGDGKSVSAPAPKFSDSVPKVVPSSYFSLKENSATGQKKETPMGGSLSGAWFKGGNGADGVWIILINLTKITLMSMG